jgi:oligopeptide transport system substrate-binding protein
MRWIRRAERALAALGLSASLSACAEPPSGPRFEGHHHARAQRGGTLMLWEDSRVRMLDPHIAFDVTSGVVVEMLYDSLYEYDYNTRMRPCIAQGMPEISADGRTFVVRIRRDVRFHNGRKLTAQDVVWSFERMIHPDLFSPGAPYYQAIEGFEQFQQKKAAHLRGLRALDDYTVEFRLARPDQSFVHTLAMRFASPVPKEEVLKRGADFKREPVGTGPFRMVSWDRGVRIVLDRNKSYYEPAKPHVERVVFEEGLKRDTAFLRFLNGEVDIMPRMSPADRILLEKGSWKRFMSAEPKSDVFGLMMNVELAPFDNVHVRRAVAAAIDRDRWARARNYNVRPTGQILPPSIPGYDAALPHRQRFDLAKAREEMRLAGFPNGLPEPVTLWTSDNPAGRINGELAQADLAKIGIQLRLKPVSFPVYLEETGKPKTAQMAAGGWSMDFPDASNFISLVSSSMKAERDSSNRSFYANPWLDDLLTQALVERDPVKRTAMYHEANDFVAHEAPWAFFANTQGAQAWQPYVKGYRQHPVSEMAIDDLWLDLPRRRVAQARRALREHFAMLTPWGGR